MIEDEVEFGPNDEEFDQTVERARMLTPSSSATAIPLRRSNGELDAEALRLDAEAERKAQPHNLPPPSEPLQVVRKFVEQRCQHGDDLIFRYWRGGWWRWRTSHWIEVDECALRSELYHFTDKACYINSGSKLVPWAPTTSKISNLLDALKAVCLLGADVNQPSWLDDRQDNRVIVATANGLLDVNSRELLKHTPAFFNQTAVPFNYDPNAIEPTRWLAFLAELFPDQPEAIDALAEWFGYVVSGRTDLQKIFLMVGPTRGGKGVIARILTKLIGRKNVAGPTLNQFGTEFGLAPLIGKSLAIVADARFGGKDASSVVERPLSISGEDTLTINRKYREQWTGKLASRLHILSMNCRS